MKRGTLWLWRRKGRVSGGILLATVAVYSSACAIIDMQVSPADQAVTLDDGRQVAYLQYLAAHSAAPRVMLLHGAPADCSSWGPLVKQQAEALAGLEVIAVDRLGYGASDRATETDLAAHAASLRPLLNPGTILVGHSYGGPVALRTAAEYPELVGGLVLVAGACDAEMQDAIWARKLGVAFSFAMPDSWDAANRELLALTDENDAMRDLLDRVTCPVVIVHGTWDPVCPHDGTVNYLQQELINADVRVVSLKRAGHNLHLTHPEVVAQEIAAAARQ